jgi:hypothetical protein
MDRDVIFVHIPKTAGTSIVNALTAYGMKQLTTKTKYQKFDNKGHSQCNNQVDWLFGKNGKLFCDFIGRYENLQKDFNKVIAYLGLPVIKLPHLNSQNLDYTEYYSNELIDIVAEIYKKDIEMFKYDFK